MGNDVGLKSASILAYGQRSFAGVSGYRLLQVDTWSGCDFEG